jgi:hypothetical protein
MEDGFSFSSLQQLLAIAIPLDQICDEIRVMRGTRH